MPFSSTLVCVPFLYHSVPIFLTPKLRIGSLFPASSFPIPVLLFLYSSLLYFSPFPFSFLGFHSTHDPPLLTSSLLSSFFSPPNLPPPFFLHLYLLNSLHCFLSFFLLSRLVLPLFIPSLVHPYPLFLSLTI